MRIPAVVALGLLALLALLAAAPPVAAPPVPVLTATPVEVPGGAGGIGFDDLGFAPALEAVLVPAGRTGDLDLFSPATRRSTAVSGFATAPAGAGRHGAGTTSADFGRGLLFAIDRTDLRLAVVDPAARKIVATAPLAASPDYVRWVEPTGEVWVTEPDAEQIEVFTLPAGDAPTPVHSTAIAVPGGPEALLIDGRRGRAYTNLWKGKSVAIDLAGHTAGTPFANGCTGSRGLALDAERGFLFVGCAEGAATVLDVDHGFALLDHLAHGAGVDIIAYDPAHHHLFLPGGRDASLAILGVSAAGKLALLATAETAPRCHCVTVDDHRQAWLCDPEQGRLLVVEDTLP
jgi:hypothetical protein